MDGQVGKDCICWVERGGHCSVPLLNRTIDDYIDDVADSIRAKICGERVSAVVLEAAREGVLSSCQSPSFKLLQGSIVW